MVHQQRQQQQTSTRPPLAARRSAASHLNLSLDLNGMGLAPRIIPQQNNHPYHTSNSSHMLQQFHRMRMQTGVFTASPRLGIPNTSTSTTIPTPTTNSTTTHNTTTTRTSHVGTMEGSMMAMTDDTLRRQREVFLSRLPPLLPPLPQLPPPPLTAPPLRRSNSTIGIRRFREEGEDGVLSGVGVGVGAGAVTAPLQHHLRLPPHFSLQQQQQRQQQQQHLHHVRHPLQRRESSLDHPHQPQLMMMDEEEGFGLSHDFLDLSRLGLMSSHSTTPMSNMSPMHYHHHHPHLAGEYFPEMPLMSDVGVGAGGRGEVGVGRAGVGVEVGVRGGGDVGTTTATTTTTTTTAIMPMSMSGMEGGEDGRSLRLQQAPRGGPLALDMATTAAAVIHNSNMHPRLLHHQPSSTHIPPPALPSPMDTAGGVLHHTQGHHHPIQHTLMHTTRTRPMDQVGWSEGAVVVAAEEDGELEYMNENQHPNHPFRSTHLVLNDRSRDPVLAAGVAGAVGAQLQGRQRGANVPSQTLNSTAMGDRVHPVVAVAAEEVEVEGVSSLMDDLTRGMPPAPSLDGSPSWKFATTLRERQDPQEAAQEEDDSFPFLDRPLRTHEHSLHQDLASLSQRRELDLVRPVDLRLHSPIPGIDQLPLSEAAVAVAVGGMGGVGGDGAKSNVMLRLRHEHERILRKQQEQLQEQMRNVQVQLQNAAVSRDQYQTLSNSIPTFLDLDSEMEKEMMQLAAVASTAQQPQHHHQQQQQPHHPHLNQNYPSPRLLQSQVQLQRHLQQHHEGYQQQHPSPLVQLDHPPLSAPPNPHSQGPQQHIPPLTAPSSYHRLNLHQNSYSSRSHHSTPTHPLFPFHRSPSTSTATSSEYNPIDPQQDLSGVEDIPMDIHL